MLSSTGRKPQLLLPFLYPFLLSPSSTTAQGVARLTRNRAPTARSKQHQRCYSTAEQEYPVSRLNPTPDDYAISNFADKAKLTIYAGGGGNGCISFLREAHYPDGPANGGDGGHGGNVYIQAVHGETSLHKLARKKIARAGRGKHGQGSSRGGQRGDDLVLAVPVGTVVTELSRVDPEARIPGAAGRKSREDSRDRWLVYPGLSSTDVANLEFPRLPRQDRLFAQPAAPIHLDLSRPTPRPILLAAGGLGGLGNPNFVSRRYTRPKFATKGEAAMSLTIELELKLLADVGLVGLPNAGKSTLLRAMSNSRARVGSWAFTTLQPNIGTVVLDNNMGRPLVTSYRKPASTTGGWPVIAEEEQDEEARAPRSRFSVADIPGLIEGAHLDKGLGIAFLRHVERAGVLAFVIDLSAGDAIMALNALWTEVGLYAQMREEEERERERDARIDWGDGSPSEGDKEKAPWPFMMDAENTTATPPALTGLHIAAKPWFVIATKGDLPDTQENFQRLRDYLAGISRGDVPHPSGVEGAWTQHCAAIPISAIHGQGVDKVIHWTVGLLDG